MFESAFTPVNVSFDIGVFRLLVKGDGHVTKDVVPFFAAHDAIELDFGAEGVLERRPRYFFEGDAAKRKLVDN